MVVPIGTEENVLERERGGRKGWRQGPALPFSPADLPGKQAAVFVADKPFGQRISYLEWVLDTGRPLEARRRADSGAQWTYENILASPGAAET